MVTGRRFERRLALGALWVVLAVAGACAQISIAVLNIRSAQLEEQDCIVVTNFMTAELQKVPGHRVLAWDDVAKMLEHQAGKQALGCDDDQCIAEIGGALGVDFIVAGDIGKLGNRYLMNLKLIDIGRAETKQRASRTVEGDMGLLIDEMPGMVSELLGRAQAAPRQAAQPQVVGPDTSNMVRIPAGSFMMGSKKNTRGGRFIHKVTLDAFYIDRTEVTQEAYEKVMGKNPSANKGCATCPVERVTWKEAAAYCEKIGKRLPTEAEWEYAGRAGTTTLYYWGDGKPGDYGWYSRNAEGSTHPVGQKKPNPWGLYDMSGNVNEWVYDFFSPDYYENSPEVNPPGPASGIARTQAGAYPRIIRGGAWAENRGFMWIALRHYHGQDMRKPTTGFRCACSVRENE